MLKIIQLLSWLITLVFLISLVVAVYQALVLGNPLPLWAWLGLIVILAVAVGLGVMLVVYRGVIREVGAFDFRSSAHLTGQLKQEQKHIPTGGVSSLQTEIKMLQGTFQLQAGETGSFEASFAYDDADWMQPRVDYVVDAARQAHLVLEQRATHRPAMRPGRNDWALRLDRELPTALDVKLGAGKAELRLAGLKLFDLRVESGVGELLVDFGGAWQHSLSANIKTGIGDTVVRLPANVGLRIQSIVGIGSLQQQDLTWDGAAYTNAHYGQVPVSLEIFLEGGMGKISLEMVHG